MLDLTPRAPRAPATAMAQSLAWALGLALLTMAPPSAAQYKWKDLRGQTHVSDMPPPADVPERNILMRPSTRSPGTVAASSAARVASQTAASAPQTGIDPELEKRRQRSEQEAKLKAQADEQRQAAQRADNCQRARQQMALYQTGQRLVRLNTAGERVVVDDATRNAEVQLAQRVIDSDCR